MTRSHQIRSGQVSLMPTVRCLLRMSGIRALCLRATYWFCVFLACVSVTAPSNPVIADEFREAEQVKETIDEVLSDPEFRHLIRTESDSNLDRSDLPQWLQNFLEWLITPDDQSSMSKPSFSMGSSLFYLALVVLVILLGVIVYFAVRNTDLKRDSMIPQELLDQEAINPSRPAGDLPSHEYAARAMAHAEREDFRSAIRELVLGCMSWTERAGLIRYRRGLTNRDYVRAVWRQEQRRESLMMIVDAFERVFYGHREADRETYESCLGQFQESFVSEVADAETTS